MRIHNNLNWELVIADLTRCCALAASGQVTAVPMSAAMNSRLATSIAMRPSNGSHPSAIAETISPLKRQVCDLLQSAERPMECPVMADAVEKVGFRLQRACGTL
jgi:hypothetical protein